MHKGAAAAASLFLRWAEVSCAGNFVGLGGMGEGKLYIFFKKGSDYFKVSPLSAASKEGSAKKD